MDPQVQTTIMPRKPNMPTFSGNNDSVRLDPVLSVSIIIFVWAIVFTGSVFASSALLQKSTDAGSLTLKKIESTFDLSGYERVKNVSQKLSLLHNILVDTVSLDLLMSFIEKNMLANVSVSAMSLNMGTEGPVLTFNGTASSFNALAKQAEIFNGHKSVKKYSTSNISLTETGKISFSGQVVFDQQLLTPINTQ